MKSKTPSLSDFGGMVNFQLDENFSFISPHPQAKKWYCIICKGCNSICDILVNENSGMGKNSKDRIRYIKVFCAVCKSSLSKQQEEIIITKLIPLVRIRQKLKI